MGLDRRSDAFGREMLYESRAEDHIRSYALRRICDDIPLNEIAAIDFYQPALGSMLGFGKIWIVYDGRNRCSIRFVSSPALFVTEVRQQISSLNRS